MIRRVPRVILLIAVLAVIGAAIWIPLSTKDAAYQVTAVLPASDPNIKEGSPVYVNGFAKGTIDQIRAQHNQAVVTFTMDGDVAPLHSGAKVAVIWQALVGERLLSVQDGPAGNPALPSGGMIVGTSPKPMELGDVLNALDPATRAHLASLVDRLNATLSGHEVDLNQTLQTAAPAVAALGDVLRGIGMDGPAIRTLVSQLNDLMARVNGHTDDVQATIQALNTATAVVAREHQALQDALHQLPGTLSVAQSTLAEVPGVTTQALPLLHDLQAATALLPGVARKLAPVLTDLRPLAAELKPTLQSASVLLNYTPNLLDSAHTAVPELNTTASSYLTPLQFLRPYTPEAVGFLTTWGSAGQNYDANGRYMRIFAEAGGTSLNVNPGVLPPGVTQDKTPAPGNAGGLGTDANGEGMH